MKRKPHLRPQPPKRDVREMSEPEIAELEAMVDQVDGGEADGIGLRPAARMSEPSTRPASTAPSPTRRRLRPCGAHTEDRDTAHHES